MPNMTRKIPAKNLGLFTTTICITVPAFLVEIDGYSSISQQEEKGSLFYAMMLK